MIKLILFCFFLCATAIAQIKISGTVTGSKHEPLPSANVYIKGAYDGATTDAAGKFSFTTTISGEITLVTSFIGYKTNEQKLVLKKKDVELNITLSENSALINTVVISAGTFEAGDEKKSVVLKPLDILTTAGALADIYGAINTLPGAEQVGETEGLFVRGGSAAETKTIIDEMVVENPFYSSIPDVQQRGRFSPSLFKGTIFSSGGYSAQYGQALSSALILKSQDLAASTISSVSLMMIGLGGFHQQRWENSSLVGAADYYNIGPYTKLFPGRLEYKDNPVTKDVSLIYRDQLTKNGLLKLYGTYSNSKVSLYLPNIDLPDNKDLFSNKNDNIYLNASYHDIIASDYNFFLGTSFSSNIDNIEFQENLIKVTDNLAQMKMMVTKEIFTGTFLNTGFEIQDPFSENIYDGYTYRLNKPFEAAFSEAEIHVSGAFAARLGARFEHSAMIEKSNFAPRIAMAWQLDDKQQFNFAYGRFYENPEKQFLMQTQNLNFESATHYILNYQMISEDQIFRVEAYYKDYNSLVKTNAPITTNLYYPLIGTYFNNSGKGYARGVDVFWRDQSTIPALDYWVSYSYLDTKRDYHNFPVMASPTFATPHTASLVCKYWIPSITSALSGTYTFATGRPYYNPNNTEFLGDRTPVFEKLSFSLSYLTSIGGNFTVIFLSLDNAFGRDNIYGYQYSADGSRREAITSPLKRSLFLGMFINFTPPSQ